MNEDKISVIIPYYHGSRYLPAIAEMMEKNASSLRNAGFKETLELILVNDSPEEELVFPEGNYAFSYSVVCMEKNSGIHAARLKGLAESKGTCILFLDQDDLIADDFFARQLKTLGEGAAAISNGFLEGSDGSKKKIFRNSYELERVNDKRIYLYSHNVIKSPGQVLIRKDHIPAEWAAGIISRNGSDDLLLWLLFLNAGDRFQTEPECLYTHVYTGENLSEEKLEMTRSSLEVYDILKESADFPEKDLKILKRSRELGIRLSESNTLKKMVLLLKNADIVIPRIFWKTKTLLLGNK